jgi:hypothetical protein
MANMKSTHLTNKWVGLLVLVTGVACIPVLYFTIELAWPRLGLFSMIPVFVVSVLWFSLLMPVIVKVISRYLPDMGNGDE